MIFDLLRVSKTVLRSKENLDSLARLEWLDLKGNQIATIGDLFNLSGLQSLQTLFLQSIDDTHGNPVCKDLAYLPTLRQALPQIAFIDGAVHRILTCV